MSYRTISISLVSLLALCLGACDHTERTIDTTTSNECRMQAMAASSHVDEHLFNQCLRDHGY
jgi:hypothetical protein